MASRKLVVEILGDSRSFERAIARSSRASRGFGTSMQTIRRTVAAAGVAVGGATTLIAKSAIDFESSFAGVRKTVDATEPQFKRLEQGFLNLSRRIPVNVNQLNELGEAAGQLGIARSGILAFTETAAKLGVTTNLAATEAAEGLARLSNILQTPQKDFGRLGSTVVELGNKLAATESELLEFGLRIAGAGRVARLAESDVLAIGGAMASVGIEAEAGGTATSKVLLSMADAAKTGGKQLAIFGEVAGTSAAEFRDAFEKDASKAFLSFVEGLGEIDKAGGNVFQTLKDLGLSDQRLIRAFLSLSGAGDLLRRSLDTGARAWKENTALTKEAEKRFATTAAQMQLFKNNLNALAVQFGRAFLPGIQKALGGLTDFLQRVGEAKTVRARLNVVWEGVQDAAQGATDALGRAVAAVDFDAVWEEARGIADGLQERLEEVDFGLIGKRIGDGIAAAVKFAIPAAKDLAARVSDAVSAIDFVELGKKMGPGLAAAVVTAFVTLLDPSFWIQNWDLALAVAFTALGGPIGRLAGRIVPLFARLGSSAVLGIVGAIESLAPRVAAAVLAIFLRLPSVALRALAPLIRVVQRVFGRLGRISQFIVKVLGIQAAINAVVGFARKIGQVFGRIAETIGDALDRAWDHIKRGAIRAALAIIEPFTHIPGFLGGGAFRDLKEQWQGTLDAMEREAQASAGRIQGSIDAIQGKTVTITIQTRQTGGPFGDARPPRATEKATRSVTAAGDKVVAAEKTVAERVVAARKKSAATVEKAAAQAKSAAERARTAFDALLDSLNLGLERALATRRLGDDLAALKKIENAILAQIKAEGRTTELARLLFQNRQQQADVLLQQRRGIQFEALGLTATGEKRVPGVGALTKRLGNLRNLIKGTFLDTPKTRSQLANIAKVLSGAFGKVGKDVRAAILQMLNDISTALSGGKGAEGPLTKAKKLNINKILGGVGLSEDEVRELRSRLSQLTSATTFTGGGKGRRPSATTGGIAAGVAGQGVTVVNVYLDGRLIETSTTKRQQRNKRVQGGSRAGTNPGGRR